MQTLVLIFGLITAVNAVQVRVVNDLRSLSGVVNDDAGNNLSGVVDEATNEKKVLYSTKTDNTGFYELKLPAGIYRIWVAGPFSIYGSAEIKQYRITSKRNTKLDFVIEITSCG